MGVGEESAQSPCCIKCKDCEDFQKVAEIKDAGVVIFRHRINTTDDVNKNNKVLGSAGRPTEDVFIFQNTRNVDIPSADIMPNLETYKISCRRCRQIYERAQKLLKRVPVISEMHVMGICDHCYQNQFPKSCYECEKIVDKFLAARYEESDTKDALRTWLSEMKHVLRDVTSYKMKTAKAKMSRANSELYIDKISKSDLRSPKKWKETDNIILVPEKRRSDSNLLLHTPTCETYGNTTGRLQSLNKSVGILDSMRDCDVGEAAGRKQSEYGATEQRSIFEELDRNLKQMRDNNIPTSLLYKSKGKSAGFLYPMVAQETHRADQGYTELGASELRSIFDELDRTMDREQMRHSPASHLYKSKHAKDEIIKGPFHELDKSVELKDSIKLRKKYRPDQRYVPGAAEAAKQEQAAFGGKTVHIFDEHSEIRLLLDEDPDKTRTLKRKTIFPKEKSDTPVLNDKQGLRIDQQAMKPIIRKTPIAIRRKKQPSSDTMFSTISRAVQDPLEKQLIYLFPKSEEKKVKVKSMPSSATLIQDTQEKIEEDKLQKEAKRVKKKQLAEEKANLIAEKKRLAEEKKRIAKEDEKKKEAEERGKEKRTKEDAKAQNIAEPKFNDKEKAISSEDKIEKEKTSPSEKDKIKNNGDRSVKVDKNKDLKLDQGVKGSGQDKPKEEKDKPKEEKNKPKEEKDKPKEEKDRAKEEKERPKNVKEEELQEPVKIKAKEEKDLNVKENLQPEGKKEKESTKYTDDIDSEPKHTIEKEVKEKDRKEGIEEKDLILKGKQLIDDREKEPKPREKAEKNRDEKELKSKVENKYVITEGIPSKKSGKNEKESGEAAKDVKTSIVENVDKKQPIDEIAKVKVINCSQEDLMLKLLKSKQATPREKKEIKIIEPLIIKERSKRVKSKGTSVLSCELDQESESIELQEIHKVKQKICNIIIGEKIFKSPLLRQNEEQALGAPLLQPVFEMVIAPMPIPHVDNIHNTPEEPFPAERLKTKPAKEPDSQQTKGVLRYALSDRTFIEKGWTMLPTEKVVRKMNVYRMRPAHPEFDWFEHNKKKGLMLYDSGEKLAEFDDNGRGRWYYKNGHLALDYYDAEEINANQRFVLYSSGEPDERGRSHPITVLATFDYLGNGVVFDHAGKIRLKYNQTEGVVLDRALGPVSHWKWHTLNDPPVLQRVMIDTQMPHKDPDIIKLGGPADKKTRIDNDEMLAIEFDNFIKEKSKKLNQTFRPFQIKIKALKINEHFSLKVLDQASVYLIYRDGTTNLKLNIGMVLDHKEIVDTDTAEVGDVSNNLERFPAKTESLAGLQRSVAYAQKFERTRTERERRLRPLIECASADLLAAASSPPLRPPLRTVPTGSTSGSWCNCKKAWSSCQIYYNTRVT